MLLLHQTSNKDRKEEGRSSFVNFKNIMFFKPCWTHWSFFNPGLAFWRIEKSEPTFLKGSVYWTWFYDFGLICLKNPFQELSETAISTYKHIGRIRSARLVGIDLAKFYLQLGQVNFTSSQATSFVQGSSYKCLFLPYTYILLKKEIRSIILLDAIGIDIYAIGHNQFLC